MSKAELDYTITSLLATPPSRADGRSLTDYRPIRVSTGVYPQANGSSRAECGGSEVVVGVMCSVTNIDEDDEDDTKKGILKCTVVCTPSAFPSYSPTALEDISDELTSILSDVYSDKNLLPPNLVIIQGKKSWTLHLDAMVLADGGNLIDILFIAASAALHNCRIPMTRSVQYKAQASVGLHSGLDTKTDHQGDQAADFELKDYWSEGEPLANRDQLPVAITLYVHKNIHFLDATILESDAMRLKILLVFNFRPKSERTSEKLLLMRCFGEVGISSKEWMDLVEHGKTYAASLRQAMTAQLSEEDWSKTEKRRQRFT